MFLKHREHSGGPGFDVAIFGGLRFLLKQGDRREMRFIMSAMQAWSNGAPLSFARSSCVVASDLSAESGIKAPDNESDMWMRSTDRAARRVPRHHEDASSPNHGVHGRRRPCDCLRNSLHR